MHDMDLKQLSILILLLLKYINRCGPLVHYWCMRYESKHKYFKKMAQTLGNFINLPKTVANRHQRYMCYKLTCSTNFIQEDVLGPG